MTAYIYRHNLDPFILEFASGIGLRWYGLAYLAGFIAAFFILDWQRQAGRLKATPDQLVDLVLTVALTGILGARAGSVFFWQLELFLQDPLSLFRIWEGGMSFHGGLLGGVGGVLWFVRKEGLDFFEVADAGVLAVTPGLMFGRVANFINGELWGRPTDGSWGVVFPGPAAGNVPRHPSQLYQALVEGPVLFLILYLLWRFEPEKGYLGTFFLVAYGLLRFLVTFYRAPDPYTGYALAGVTRGQVFSLAMVAVGLGMLFWLNGSWSTKIRKSR